MRCTVRALPGHGGEQLVAALNWHSPRVHEHEATGAIGVLGHARRETRLIKRGRLLITCHAGNGDGRAQQVGIG